MQKKLIALAVASMASTAAFAQSNVTIYGLLQPSYDVMDLGSTSATNMEQNSSRIGFRGEEALGNGLKAIFQLESKIKFTEQGSDDSLLGSRDSWVGLAGSFGSLTFGNHQTAYKKVADFADPFADTIADYNNIMANFDGSGADYFNGRHSRSAYYTSPNFGGFQAAASYALSETNGDGTPRDDVAAIGGTYTNGGLTLMAGYQNNDQSASSSDQKAWKVGGAYKFSFGTKISAIYEDLEQDQVFDVKNYYISATHPITSNIDLMAAYANRSDNKAVAGPDTGADNWSLGVDYKFSKRTSVQGIYTSFNNKEGSQDGLDAGYTADKLGGKVSGFSVRMRHAF